MYKEGTNPILSHSAAAADTNISLSTSNANNTNTTNDQSSDSLGYITTAASSQIPAIDQSSSELIHKPIAQGNQDSDSEVEVVAVTQDPSFGTSQHHQHGTQQQQQQQPNRHAQYARSADQPVGQPEASSRPVQHQQQYHAANDTSSATNISQHQHSHQNQQQQHQQQNQQHQQPTKKYQMYKPYVIAHTSFDLFKGHEPTWEYIWPKMKVANPAPILKTTNQVRAYKLSLLSNTECTITAVLHHTNTFDYQPSLMGMRKPIKEITRLHSKEGEKAVLEEGRWRIPLSVYQVFYSYLCNQSGTVVEKIPQAQLNIATLGRAVAERGYPSAEELTDRGIPIGLANALAPYQRGGVDFVLQRNGKALIADEMGLGKTVQGIAAMACFSNEWPVLILSPSSARYHWEAEFLNWLGKDSDINAAKPMGEEDLGSDDLHLDDLEDFIGDINNWEEQKADVSDIFNINNIKRKQTDGNKPKSKKMKPATMKLLDPSEVNVLTSSSDTILKSNTRVVIVSYGLIANLTKKHLLVPNQFKCIIVDESHMLKNKNSKRTLSVMPLLKKAERVVMLSGTPALAKPEDLFPQLNALGEGAGWWNDEEEFRSKYVKDKYSDPSFAELHTLLTSTVMIRRMKNDILKDMPSKMRENVHINVRDPILGQTIKDGLLTLRQGKGVLGKLSLLHQNLDSIENRIQPPPTSNGFDGFHQNNVPKDTEDGYVDGGSRKAILNKIFRLSGTAKIPALVDMLKRWLSNPENGKLCIFAHHINVLDALVRLGGLSNALRSTTKYIRIDGSTNPKFRQEQITSFQNDPTVKIAVLGITAAGVGVTLTAASTIWFAELFWTPALMIQAEDRCHRIGQQAQVRVLYTIAKGTLDEVLWILLKRKFRALGEFVEGKEMMDIILHKTYANEFDAVNRKCEQVDIDSDSDDAGKKEDANALADEYSIQHEIEELATEDIQQAAGNEDDCFADDAPPRDRKEKASDNATQHEIICLSDDEVDEPSSNPTLNMTSEEILAFYMKRKDQGFLLLPKSLKLRNTTFFSMFFPGPHYGITFYSYSGRSIVLSNKLSKDPEGPQVGDVLVAVNQWVARADTDFQEVLSNLRQSLHEASNTSPVRLMFCRDKSISVLIKYMIENMRKQAKLARQTQEEASPIIAVASETKNTAGNVDSQCEDQVIVLDE